jgi:predicted transcriptional regulator
MDAKNDPEHKPMTVLQIHVGESFADTEQRALSAVERFERGETIDEHHLTFESWRVFARVMTANRLELLRHVHRNPQKNVLALSKALKCDYRRVREDVEALAEVGLLNCEGGGISTDYDGIQIAM